MSAIIRFIIGFAFAGISAFFYNISSEISDPDRRMPVNLVAIVAAIGAGIFILLGILEIAKKSRRDGGQASLADELRKLDDLRKSGAISDKEFELQKSKLM